MLNTESGDNAMLEVRDCGCAIGAFGFRTHVTGLRSQAKLTSEGVTFAGAVLYELVEQLLPERFGGNSTDYQLVEEEERGLARVSVVVAPRVGAVDEAAVIDLVAKTLGSQPLGGRLMTQQWLEGGTLRVQRREPYTTSSAKILPLHLLKAKHNSAKKT
jgi:hypothetical protein